MHFRAHGINTGLETKYCAHTTISVSSPKGAEKWFRLVEHETTLPVRKSYCGNWPNEAAPHQTCMLYLRSCCTRDYSPATGTESVDCQLWNPLSNVKNCCTICFLLTCQTTFSLSRAIQVPWIHGSYCSVQIYLPKWVVKRVRRVHNQPSQKPAVPLDSRLYESSQGRPCYQSRLVSYSPIEKFLR